MFITEVLSRPVPWKWIHKDEDSFMADFRIGHHEYLVSGNRRRNSWIVEFAFIGKDGDGNGISRTDITGTRNEIPVFATVLDILKRFKESYYPEIIKFSAEEPSRQKLYTRIISKLFPDWKLIKPSPNVFVITNPEDPQYAQVPSIRQRLSKYFFPNKSHI